MRHVLLFLLLVFTALPIHAKMRVFACEPEWAALTRELAGDRADVFTATTAQQDPHHIQARPALIAQLRRADLAVCTGAELELGWLPMLQRRANNPKVVPGRPGYFEVAATVVLLDKPTRVDRADGDIHADGNPHLHLDPRNIAIAGRALTERLIEIDAANAEHYHRRGLEFQQRWQAALGAWETRARPLEGMPVIVAHRDWVYLAHWLGLRTVAALESKPGVPASSGHLAQVLTVAKEHRVPAVLYAAYQPPRAAHWLAERSAVRAVELPYTVGGSARATDLFGLFDDTLDRLLEVRR